jgi:hypothetical protein
VEADRAKIEQRINFTRENYRMMREELLKTVLLGGRQRYSETHSTRSYRSGQDRRHDGLLLALLNAEIANGMYKKPIQ